MTQLALSLRPTVTYDCPCCRGVHETAVPDWTDLFWRRCPFNGDVVRIEITRRPGTGS